MLKEPEVTTFGEAFHDAVRKECDCAIPSVQRKWNDFLGTMQDLRLCCMAKALEELTEIPMTAVYYFEPKMEWDCGEELVKEAEDGTKTTRLRGAPLKWMLKRMAEKGIEPRNL